MSKEQEELEAKLPEHLRHRVNHYTTLAMLRWMVATKRDAHVGFGGWSGGSLSGGGKAAPKPPASKK